jgi:hypothetical protein
VAPPPASTALPVDPNQEKSSRGAGPVPVRMCWPDVRGQ